MDRKTKSPKKGSTNRIFWIAGAAVVILAVIAGAVVVSLERSDLEPAGEVLVGNREVGVQEAYQQYQEGVFLLDVRTPEEYQTGHIPGATLIPLDQLAARAGELPVGEPILIYCRSGNRSLQAMNLLGQAGFQGLSSLEGGINAWIGAGFPVE